MVRLGYQQGQIIQNGDALTYRQKGWGGFEYEVSVRWRKTAIMTWEGVWRYFGALPQQTQDKGEYPHSSCSDI
ncbi:MAG: hypothetical protein R2822_25375 [Spirosomataceae bacterium]